MLTLILYNDDYYIVLFQYLNYNVIENMCFYILFVYVKIKFINYLHKNGLVRPDFTILKKISKI